MDDLATNALPCGDSARMGRILSALEPRLVAVARRLLRDPDAAADVVQNTFEKVLRYCAQFDGRAKVSTWLHRIVVNEAFQWRRKEARRSPARLEAEDWNLIFGHPQDPECQAAAREAQARLERALASLPKDQGTLLTRSVLQGRSHAAIGRELGVSTQAVKARARRARERLARELLG